MKPRTALFLLSRALPVVGPLLRQVDALQLALTAAAAEIDVLQATLAAERRRAARVDRPVVLGQAEIPRFRIYL